MTNQMLLAAIQPNEQIYFITSNSNEYDGVVVRRDEVAYVPFWSYINNNAGAITRIKGNDFLDVMWDGGRAMKSDEWNEKFINRTTPFTKDDLKSVSNLLVDVPKEHKPKFEEDISQFEGKSLNGLIEIKAPRTPLKMEPYDPDARDGDNDGIVQEGTSFERPAGTRLMDAAGILLERGRESSPYRMPGLRVIDADGNDVDYTPTYERSRTGTIGAGRQLGASTSKPDAKPEPKKPVADKPTQETPEVKPKKPGSGSALSDHGSGTLKERGLRDVRAAAAPPPPPEPKKPEPEKPDAPKPEVPEGEYRMSHQPSDDGPRAFDLTEDGGGDWSMPGDVYDNPHLYTGADATVRKETMEQLERVRGNPDGLVTVYRYAPEGREFEVGNWVSLSEAYARQHGESNPTPGGTVQSMQVPAKEVRFAGDDLAEFGWYPEPESVKPEKPDAPKPKKSKVKPPKAPMRQEKYQEYLQYGEGPKPNENGLLQEGTIWERPLGTEFLDDATGYTIRPYDNRKKRPAVLVDIETREPVDYVPTYERPGYVPPGGEIVLKPIKEGQHEIFAFYDPGEGIDLKDSEKRIRNSSTINRNKLQSFVDELSDDDLKTAFDKLNINSKEQLVDLLVEKRNAEFIAQIEEVRQRPIYVAITPKGLNGLLKSKRYKTQFEKTTVNVRNGVRQPGGVYDPEARREAEKKRLGIPVNLPDNMRPAYGFQLTNYEHSQGLSPTAGRASESYGNLAIKLKDSVRPRATMTDGDSYDWGVPAIPVDGEVSEERVLATQAGWSPQPHLAEDATKRYLVSDVLGRDYENPDLEGQLRTSEYSEVQIHGGFSIDDIEEVVLPVDMDYDRRQQILKALEKAGIKATQTTRTQ